MSAPTVGPISTASAAADFQALPDSKPSRDVKEIFWLAGGEAGLWRSLDSGENSPGSEMWK